MKFAPRRHSSLLASLQAKCWDLGFCNYLGFRVKCFQYSQHGIIISIAGGSYAARGYCPSFQLWRR